MTPSFYAVSVRVTRERGGVFRFLKMENSETSIPTFSWCRICWSVHHTIVSPVTLWLSWPCRTLTCPSQCYETLLSLLRTEERKGMRQKKQERRMRRNIKIVEAKNCKRGSMFKETYLRQNTFIHYWFSLPNALWRKHNCCFDCIQWPHFYQSRMFLYDSEVIWRWFWCVHII